MKLEKREITLNERDSIMDVYYFEKHLLNVYTETLSKATRKEVRGVLSMLMKEVGEDMGITADLLKKAVEKCGV